MTADTLYKAGHIVFEFEGQPERMDVHIFRADSVQGTPAESDGESESRRSPARPSGPSTHPASPPTQPAVGRVPLPAHRALRAAGAPWRPVWVSADSRARPSHPLQRCGHSGSRWTGSPSRTCGRMTATGSPSCFRRGSSTGTSSSRGRTPSWTTSCARWPTPRGGSLPAAPRAAQWVPRLELSWRGREM